MRGSLKILGTSTLCVLAVLAFIWGIGGASSLTLAPALIALSGAFATRRPALALVIGAFVGAVLASHADWLSVPGRFAGYSRDAVGDSDHLRIIGFTLCLGVVARAASQRLTGALKLRMLESMAPASNPPPDTTIISAAASGCDTMQHVLTQLPYAITVGVVALVQHASVTVLPPGWALVSGSCVLVAIVRWVGRPSETLPA